MEYFHAGIVEALRPDDPRSCQMDARFQPR